MIKLENALDLVTGVSNDFEKIKTVEANTFIFFSKGSEGKTEYGKD